MLWACLALALAQDAPLPAPGPTAAQIRQELLPALKARQLAAEARSDDGRRWFRGEATLDEAFPSLAGGRLWAPSFVEAATRSVVARSAQRAAERVVDPGTSPLAPRLRVARDLALDAEDAADAVVLRFLGGLAEGLRRNPQLTDASLAEVLEAWRAAQQAAMDAPPPEGDAGPEPESASGPGSESVADADLEAPAAERARRAADAEIAMARLRLGALRQWTIPGDESVDQLVAADVEGASDLAGDPWHRDRLARALPLVRDPALRDLVEAQLEYAEGALVDDLRRRAEALEAELAAPVAPLEEGVEAEALGNLAAQLRAAADSAGESVVDGAAPLAAARHRVADLQAQLAERRHLAALAAAKRAPVNSEVADEKAAALRRAAEGSLESLEQDGRLADLQRSVAALREQAATLFEAEAARARASDEALAELEVRLESVLEESAAALSLPPLSTERRRRVDGAYLQLRELVTDLYGLLDGLRRTRHALRVDTRQRRAALEADWATQPAQTEEVAQLASEWQEAVSAVEEAYAHREQSVANQVDAANALLVTARDERRRMRAFASSTARRALGRDFVPELTREVAALPDQILTALRALAQAVVALPAMLLDLNAVWAFIVRSTELLLLVIGWWFVRRNARPWLERLLATTQGQFAWAPAAALARWRAQLQDLAQHLLDLIVGLLLLGWLTPRAPAIGLLALGWVMRSAWRAIPNAVSALLSTPAEPHPALAVVSAETERALTSTARVFVAWYAVTRVVGYIALRLLDADRLRDLVAGIGSVVFWVLLAWVIAAWAGSVRSAMQRVEQPNALTRWIARADQSSGIVDRILVIPRSALGLVYLGARLVVTSATELVERRAGFGWLQSMLARRQLRTDGTEGAARGPQDPALVSLLTQSDPVEVPRPIAEQRLRDAFGAWRDEQRRGLVSLTGDTGSGTARILQRIAEVVDLQGMPTAHVRVTTRIIDPVQAAAWLAEGLALTGSSTVPLEERLRELPPAVIAIEDAHRLFLRTVGGHAALRTIIEAMHATSDHHFWVLGVHEPAWNYLNRIAARLKLDAFRAHIHLEPMDADALANWLEHRMADAEWTISYAPLTAGGPIGADPALAERRARNAFWRLLANASQGNPDVAQRLWLRHLDPAPGTRTVGVRMADGRGADDLDDLSDDLLFVLTALVEHDAISAEHLGEVLNTRVAESRASCRHLEGLGVVSFDVEALTYTLVPTWRPAVQRRLRQKHFLHWD